MKKSITFCLVALTCLAALMAEPAMAASNSTVTVKPTAMNGWYFWNDANDTFGGPGALVTGPGTPPLGIGSVELGPLTASSGDGAHAVIATDAYHTTPISNLTSLSYSTYQTGP